jgi:hypothetical protein
MKFASPYQALRKRQSLIYRASFFALPQTRKRFPNKNTQWKID